MRKIQILFALLFTFSIFLLKTGSVYAECQEINPFVSSCGSGGLGIFQCSDQNTTYCCSQSSTECQIGTITTTPTPGVVSRCLNGAADGAVTCLSVREGESFICHPGQALEFELYQTCSSDEKCVEFVGCQKYIPTPTTVSATIPASTLQPTIQPTFTPNPRGSGNITTDSFLIMVNPLNVGYKFGGVLGIFNVLRFDKPSDILNVLMPFLFVFAGMILFVMLLWGGFEMLSSAATPDSKNAGQQRITAAIIGFVLLFVSYWIAQIVQFITGVNVLG